MAHKLKKSKAQALLDKLFELTIEKTEKVPEGYLSIDQWMNVWGLCRSRSTDFLNNGVSNGLLETRKFRTFEKGRYYRRKFYREIV